MTEPTPPTPGDDGDAQRIIFAITAALLVLVVAGINFPSAMTAMVGV